jgi:tRNA pseudouridine32 synthase/23S rRNA pseudouridine746 synthase
MSLPPRKSGDETTEYRQPPLPADFEISILYEDYEILVVNKPYDIRIDGDFPVTVEKLIRTVLAIPMDKFRLCNQLDYATSGILVLGKSKGGARNCNRLFVDRRTIKYYLALGVGTLSEHHSIGQAIHVREPIAEVEGDFRMNIDHETGLFAETIVTPISQIDNNQILFLVRILTGRRHQIRLHLKHLGYPILGDATYGTRDDKTPRMFLHAWKLILPFNDRTVIIRAPLVDSVGLTPDIEQRYINELDNLSSY